MELLECLGGGGIIPFPRRRAEDLGSSPSRYSFARACRHGAASLFKSNCEGGVGWGGRGGRVRRGCPDQTPRPAEQRPADRRSELFALRQNVRPFPSSRTHPQTPSQPTGHPHRYPGTRAGSGAGTETPRHSVTRVEGVSCLDRTRLSLFPPPNAQTPLQPARPIHKDPGIPDRTWWGRTKRDSSLES